MIRSYLNVNYIRHNRRIARNKYFRCQGHLEAIYPESGSLSSKKKKSKRDTKRKQIFVARARTDKFKTSKRVYNFRIP